MNAIPSGAVAGERLGTAADEQNSDKSSDAAWIVLEAANDLGDHATVEACRRVIDANLNGTVASVAEKLKHRAQKSDLPASGLAAAGTPC